MTRGVSSDGRLIELGAAFDELTAAMDRIPAYETIPEALHDGLAQVTTQIEELSGTSRVALHVKEHVRRYYESIGAEDLELAIARSLLRDLLR